METPFSIYRDLPREERYRTVTPLILSLLEGDDDPISRMANTAAALKEAFGFLWVGFYIAHPDGTLHLGPFQGPVACTRIGWGKGVCGTAWKEARTLIVDDVERFPGHIACSNLSRSEIVVPFGHPQAPPAQAPSPTGVLDIDSEHLAHFTPLDQQWLEQLCEKIFR